MKTQSLAGRLIAAALLSVLFSFNGSGLHGQATKPATAAESTPVFRSTTRMVTVDVVVKDKHGHPVQDLTAQDFQVFEQVPPKR